MRFVHLKEVEGVIARGVRSFDNTGIHPESVRYIDAVFDEGNGIKTPMPLLTILNVLDMDGAHQRPNHLLHAYIAAAQRAVHDGVIESFEVGPNLESLRERSPAVLAAAPH